jgi:Mn-dependent DtxR family transcriptional regulator
MLEKKMPEGDSAREVVIKYLDAEEIPVNPTAITWYLDQKLERPPSRRTVTNALEALEEEGLVENTHKSYWRITDQGREVRDGQEALNEN